MTGLFKYVLVILKPPSVFGAYRLACVEEEDEHYSLFHSTVTHFSLVAFREQLCSQNLINDMAILPGNFVGGDNATRLIVCMNPRAPMLTSLMILPK